MSFYDSDSERDKFDDFLDENEFILIQGSAELYECPGGHIWTFQDVLDLYNKSLNKGE